MRQCIFCREPANSREHLWPEWTLNILKPKGIRGQLGANEIRTQSALKVRTVCATCNGGWMSNLETAIKPILEPLMRDKSTNLDASQQEAIAAWSLKTAMVLDSTTRSVRRLFYTQNEREELKTSRTISFSTMVWLGRYIGQRVIGANSLDTSYKLPDSAVCQGRITTLHLGCLLTQVMTVHVAPRRAKEIIGINPSEGAWEHFLITVWPTSGCSVYWPPVLAFDDSKTITDISTLSERWQLGSEQPIGAKTSGPKEL